MGYSWDIPSGKRLHSYGKLPFLMGKLTINDQMINLPSGYVKIAIGHGHRIVDLPIKNCDFP